MREPQRPEWVDRFLFWLRDDGRRWHRLAGVDADGFRLTWHCRAEHTPQVGDRIPVAGRLLGEPWETVVTVTHVNGRGQQ